MDLEIITIGTELLLGFTIDTNAAEIAQAVAAAGARVTRRATVSDQGPEIRDAVAGGLRRSGWVIASGGLGPTKDDLTKRAVAQLFDAPLELDHEYLRTLERRFASLGRGPMPATNTSQAEVPRGAVVLPNPRGTAPGLWLEGRPGIVILLPGVPHEMRGVLREEVVPRLAARIRLDRGAPIVTRSRTLRTTGITESALADLLRDLDDKMAPVSIAYLPQGGGVDLRLTVWGLPPDRADAVLERAALELRPLVGSFCYGEGEVDLAAVVVDLLRSRRLRLGVAESCTGGLVGARITAIPGASDVFAGGVISYSNESKIRDLDVPPGLIDAHGAVSEPVVRSMAEGVVRRFATEAAIAVTGIAGPEGGTPEKPVGTVWLASRVGSRERAVRVQFPGGRHAIRERGAQAALNLVRGLLAEPREPAPV